MVLAGYDDSYEGEISAQYHANPRCYELLPTLRSMNHLGDWFRLFDLDVRIDDAANRHRPELDTREAD